VARKKGKEFDSRSALLDAAWTLLLEQGAGGMSVEAIVGRAGLSKGTFFHFFPAKQDLLDAICARIADESWAHASRALQRADLDPVGRLDLFLQEARAWRSERTKAIGALWRELVRDENAALMNRVRELSVARLAPTMTDLFVEATTAGLMRVGDAQVAGRLTVEWLTATVEGTLRLLAVRRDAEAIDLGLRRANSTLEAFERLLGIAEGSLGRVDRQVVARLAADVPGSEDAGSPALGTGMTSRRRRPPVGNGSRRDHKQKGASRHGTGRRED
jgi:AcrR family transcriptional regulator